MSPLKTMAEQKSKTILITGCSQGGLGEGLSLELHARGYRVIATARDPSKLRDLKLEGITCLQLDVCNEESIQACISQVSQITAGTLDMLINNAGGGYSTPVTDIDLERARKLFDLNVWSYVRMTQVALPLLLKTTDTGSGQGKQAIIVNNSSVVSVFPQPYGSVYHASKAASAMISDCMRVELEPFGLKVVDLKTGTVKTRFHDNRLDRAQLPEKSLYDPIREEAETAMSGKLYGNREERQKWAKDVVNDLLSSWAEPPTRIWRGAGSGWIWFLTTFRGHRAFDTMFDKDSGLAKLKKVLKSSKRSLARV